MEYNQWISITRSAQFEGKVTICKNWIGSGIQNTKNFDESKAPGIDDLSGSF